MAARGHGHTPRRARSPRSRPAAPFTRAGADAPSLPGAPGVPRPHRGTTAAGLRPEAAARRGLVGRPAEGSGSARCTAPPRAPRAPGPGPAPHSRARRRKLRPAGRKLWPQPGPCLAPAPSHATKGCGVVEGPPRPQRDPQRPGRAEGPLPPAERSPVVAGSSLTRAMVAVAILRPSRPQRAPHAPAPSAVSRDVGACGGARRKRELSR